MTGILPASILCALIYGVFFSNAKPSILRVGLKTAATALLTVSAYLSGAPLFICVALAFSTLGDALLGASEEKFLQPGMAAFFVAHAAYIPLFWEHASVDRNLPLLIVQLLITLGGAFFIRSLLPWVEKAMRLPVILYAVIILVMANAALRLDEAYWLATLGALMFVSSDIILSFELFKLKPDAPIRRLTARLVWVLYFGGQAAIAWSFIHLAA